MESFGQILRETREKKNLSVDQIARDTRISKRYLEALEAEDFTVFPGETYLTGFLRNYADYLSLNAEDMVGIYRNMRIQEQPLPMDELLKGRKGMPPGVVILVALAAVGILGGGYALLRFLGDREPRPRGADESQQEVEGEEFLFETDGLTQWFKIGDVITVPLADRRYPIGVSVIDDEKVELSVPGGTIRLTYSEDRLVDLNLDSRPDIKMVFNDVDLLAANKRVNLSLTKLLESEQIAATAGETTAAVESLEQLAPQVVVSETASDLPTAPPPSTAVRAEAEDRLVILTADSPDVFAVKVDFRGSTLFRYLQDGGNPEQRFFQKAETFSVDNVRKGILLWISNAGAVRVTVQGQEVAMGRPGQVVTKQIQWVQSESSGRYQLEVSSVF